MNQASHSGKKRSGQSNPPILFVPPAAAHRHDSLFSIHYCLSRVSTFLYASNNFVISGGFQNREDAVYWAQNTKRACSGVDLENPKPRQQKGECLMNQHYLQ
ncbi:MAG: hypothetical protein WA039_03805, partial [Gemmiger qucibialis]